MNNLDPVLGEFVSDITRAKHLLLLIKTFRGFGGSTAPASMAEVHENSWPEALALLERSKGSRTDLPLLSGSLLLYLAGRFEYFMKQVVETMAEYRSANCTKYSDLPESLRKELRRRILEVAQNPRKFGLNDLQTDLMLANMVENSRDSAPPVDIGSSVISITESNMRDSVVSDLMKRVGMNDFWKELGKQAKIKLHLERAVESETIIEAQSRLNKLMDDRNQIAHPTSTTTFPDPDQVLATVEFLSVFASVTIEIVKVHLAFPVPESGRGR